MNRRTRSKKTGRRRASLANARLQDALANDCEAKKDLGDLVGLRGTRLLNALRHRAAEIEAQEVAKHGRLSAMLGPVYVGPAFWRWERVHRLLENRRRERDRQEIRERDRQERSWTCLDVGYVGLGEKDI